MTASLVIKRTFWLAFTSALTVVCFGSIYLFLLQQRATSALNELRSSKLEELNTLKNSISTQERKLRYVISWFRTKDALLAVNNTYWRDVTANVFSQLIRQEGIQAPELTSQCEDCSDAVYKNLQYAQQKITELELSKKRLDSLVDLYSKLKTELSQKIKLHQILAKDFERLVGSPSAYNSNKSTEDILYFVSGPFKWLPLLDTSKVDKSLQTSEVGNLSIKLESLKHQSKGLIDSYLDLKVKYNEAAKEQVQLQKHIENLNINVSLQLISVWDSYLPLFGK